MPMVKAPYYILDLVKIFRERLPQVEVSVEIGTLPSDA